MSGETLGTAATLGAAWATGGASLLGGLKSLTDTGSATSAATSGAGAGAGAGSITFGETKPNWTLIGAVIALGLVAVVLAKGKM